MKKNTIVSLADSNYFYLLNELIDSIRQFSNSSSTAICILDAGLSEDQKKILSPKVDEIKSAEWDIKVPAIKVLFPKSNGKSFHECTIISHLLFIKSSLKSSVKTPAEDI